MKDYQKLKLLNLKNKELLKVRRNILSDTKKYREAVRLLILNNTYEIINEIQAYRIAVDHYLYKIKPRIFLKQIREDDPTIRSISDYYKQNYNNAFNRKYKLLSSDSGEYFKKKLYPKLKIVKLKETSLLATKGVMAEDSKFNFNKDMQILLDTDIKKIRYFYANQVLLAHKIQNQDIYKYLIEKLNTDIKHLNELKLTASSKNSKIRIEIINEYEIFRIDILPQFIIDLSQNYNSY